MYHDSITDYQDTLNVLSEAYLKANSLKGSLKLLSALRHIRKSYPEYARFQGEN